MDEPRTTLTYFVIHEDKSLKGKITYLRPMKIRKSRINIQLPKLKKTK